MSDAPASQAGLAGQAETFATGPVSVQEARSPEEQLLRRRCAAAAVDLLLLALAALLLAQARWSFSFIAVGLFLMRDWGEGYSPGKRLFNLIAFDSPDRYCTLTASVLRNVTLLPPVFLVELLMLLFSHRGRRLGDILASSTVELRTGREHPDGVNPPAPGSTPGQADAEGTVAPATSEPPTTEVCSVDDMIIDAGTFGPSPEEAQGETISDTEAPGETCPAAGATQPVTQAATAPISPDVAARCLGIDGEVTYESLDDAYWRYVERFSPDAVEELDTGELLARCAELAASRLGLPVPAPPPPGDSADRAAALAYLNEWFVIINKCRDSLS